MKKTLITIGVIVGLLLFFWLGFRTYPLLWPCPEIKSDTVYVYDTVEHHIRDTVPWYIVRKDTVIVREDIPAIVDTVAILTDYYMIHYYDRDWYDITPENDTLIHISLKDAITENKPIDNNFSYRYYKLQIIVNNSVTNINYSRYLYVGLSVPLNDYKFASGNVYLANKRLLIGVGYIPYYKSFNVTAGFKLASFKR